MSRSTFYDWKKTFRENGAAGLIRRKPVAINHPKKLAPDVVEKIIELRKTYHLGPERFTWYLERYHGIKTSCSSVCRTLVRQGLQQLPKGSDHVKHCRPDVEE